MMTLRTTRQLMTLPGLPSAGPLPPMVSIVVPIARLNMATNPSVELATTGYTAVGGSIARSAAQQYHGTYSLAVTLSSGAAQDGVFYGPVSLTSGVTYAASVKVLALEPNMDYAISIATTGGVDLATYQFRSTGRWQWVWVLYKETSTTTRRIYIRKANTRATVSGNFFIDGLQLEDVSDGILSPSTYIDGDQQGLLVGQQPPAYLWTGTPHASTSTRSALTRAGGYLVNLSLYNFVLTGILGLGMAVPNNVSVPYTVLDGARFLRTTKPPRSLTLTGRFQDDDMISLMQNRSDLRVLIDRDLIPIQQPLLLHVEPKDDCNVVIGNFATVQCLYAGGLDGNDTNVLAEDVAPTFTMYVPYLVGGDGGAALTTQLTTTNANRILRRSPAGLWSAMSTGASSLDVFALAVGLDGKIYIGGRFADLGGVANTDGIGYWDPSDSAFHAMGTGVSSGTVDVSAIAVAPNGDVIVGGDFSLMGGVANTLRLARWDGSNWNALSTGVNGKVRALTYNAAGLLYLGGDFTNAGGDANADEIASWNGSAFAAVGSAGAVGGLVYALKVAPNGYLYAGGDFTGMGGVLNTKTIAVWTGSVWRSIAPNMTASIGTVSVTAIAIGLNGIVYVSGNFTSTGAVALNYIGAWNGAAWAPLGSGFDSPAFALTMRADGVLIAGGAMTTASGIPLPDGQAQWNGSTWLPLDVDLPGSARVTALLTTSDGTLYLGYNTAGSAFSAANMTVTNDTPGLVYPTLIVKGPTAGTSHLYQIVNYTTRVGVWFNLILSVGETATFSFDPANPSYTSTFQGDLTSTIMPGSQPSLFYLAPGPNTISVFAASSTVVATLNWQKHYNGMADMVN